MLKISQIRHQHNNILTFAVELLHKMIDISVLNMQLNIDLLKQLRYDRKIKLEIDGINSDYQ